MGLQNTVDDKGGIHIHTIDCDVLSSTEIEPEYWLDLGWRRSAEQSAATARITVTVEHIPGALADLTRIIGEADGNLVNIKTVKRSPVFFDMVMDVEVRDRRHLVQIIAALRASAYVITAERAHGEIITST